MNDWFTQLTRLMRRLGSKLRRLKCIWSVSSSAYFRHSRGEFDQILWWFTINPAPIGSQSSRNAGGSWRTQDFTQKLLNSLTIQSKRKNHVLQEKSPRKSRTVQFREDGSTVAIARSSWATIPWSPHLSLAQWSHVSCWASSMMRLNRDRRILLIPQFAHVSWWWLGGPESTRSTLLTWRDWYDAPRFATCPTKLRNRLVPHV